MAEFEVLVMEGPEIIGLVWAVMLVDKPVPVCKPLKTISILYHVIIRLVEAGDVVDELELVGTDGGSGSNEGRESERVHK